MVLLGKASSTVVMPSSADAKLTGVRDAELHEEGNVKPFALQYDLQYSPSKQGCILMAMAERLGHEELNKPIKILTDRGILKTQDIKSMPKHYKMEIQRHVKLAGELVRPKNWTNKSMLDWLKEKKLTDLEARWVLELLAKFTKEKEFELEIIKEAKKGNILGVGKADTYKMQLYEALFLEEY
eukprot:9390256-Ditylum_brightwellii.AAC.1